MDKDKAMWSLENIAARLEVIKMYIYNWSLSSTGRPAEIITGLADYLVNPYVCITYVLHWSRSCYHMSMIS